VFSLNVIVPLGLLIHFSAIFLSIVKYKESQLYVILRFLFFLLIVHLVVVFGNHLFFVWFEEYFPLRSFIWWLF